MSPDPTDIVIRPLEETDSLKELTELLHRAYSALAEMGLRYVATYQDVETTRRRVARGTCFVAKGDGCLVGTITYYGPDSPKMSEWGQGDGVAHIGQLGVEPSLQRSGIGTRLVHFAENFARSEGATSIGLDTAEPARHLIEWYERLGYRFVQYADWDVTNYRSVIMRKQL